MVAPFDLSLPLLLVGAGIILVVAEAMAPGAHLIVLGVALLGAGLVGLAAGSVLPAVAGPFVLAALVLGFGAAALWVYREFDFYGGKGEARTRDSASLRGATGRVTETVTETDGEVKIDRGGFNPFYAARTTGGEIAPGTEVIVVDPGGGNVVTVEAIGAIDDEIERELARGREASDAVETATEDEAEEA